MRPLKLTMSAFGCYADKQTIDFDKLGTEGLYLITGNTGAGKTTIFDEITCALYGETSGNNRKADMLRSKYAAANAETYVELSFRYHDQMYFIKRNPSYLRAKQRGEGMTEEKADAQLHLPDQSILTKLKEVNAKVEAVLGINREQFVQIAMIAQGEFLKVLHAGTENRIEIFRKIFYTDTYKTFQDRVRKDVNTLASEIKDQRRSYEYSLLNVQVDAKDDQNKQKLSEAQAGRLLMEEVVPWLQQIISADQEISAVNEKLLEEISRKLAEINKRVGQAEQDKKVRDTLKAAQERLPSEIKIRNEAEAALNEQHERQPQYEALKAQIADIERSLKKYQELQNLINLINDTKNQLSTEKQKNDHLQNKQSADILTLEQAKNELQSLADAEVKVEALGSQQAMLTAKKNSLKGLFALLEDYSRLITEHTKAQKDYIEKSLQAKTKRLSYEKMNKAYLDEQAGILAIGLNPGQPCPVCGSVDHPAPAALSMKAPTKEALDKAKMTAENADSQTVTASERVSGLNGQSLTKRNEMMNTATILLGDITFDDIPMILEKVLADITNQMMEMEQQLSLQKKRVIRKEDLHKIILLSEKDLETVRAELVESKEKVVSLTTQMQSDCKTRDKQIAELRFQNEADAKSEILSLASQKKGYEEELQAAQIAYQAATMKAEGTTTQIQILLAQLSQSHPLDLDALLKEKSVIENTQRELREDSRVIGSRISTNRNAVEALEKTSKTIHQLEARYKVLKEISDTANGDISGKEKIKLETYIQATYFDRIVARANLRLLQMSNSQFELKRRDASGKQGQSGLDLNVIDHYNGTERDAKTLSGGESFIASLSLALGLSDEIQNNAGGIRLDSMFVDEGFDSLDETKLAQAMQALMSISQTNRLIGIISHVTGLDEKIGNKIVVTKDHTGSSRAEIILN